MTKVEIEELMKKLDIVISKNEMLENENKNQRVEIDLLRGNNNSFNVEIGCNALMGVTLSSASGDIDVEVKFNDIVSFSSEDIRSLLKSGEVRNMFSSCLVYFIDEQNYNKFGIKKRVDICTDTIINVIKSRDAKIIKNYFDESTNKKFDMSVLHSLFYKIVILNLENKFGDIPFETRKLIEEYFGMQMEMAGKLYVDLKKNSMI